VILGRVEVIHRQYKLEPCIEIGCDAYVALTWNCETLEEIVVFHEGRPPRTPTRRCFERQPSS
jgi:hypothetical protein